MSRRLLQWLLGLLLCSGVWLAQAQTTVEYIHTDALGSVVAVTNEAGQVIERFDYEPYGAIIGQPNYGGVGFTGHVQDAATGLTYMQQRYYDSQTGRFLSIDPVAADVASGENFNRYRYGANSPYRFIDPDGRKEYDCRKSGCDSQIKVADLKPGDVVFTKGADVSVAKNGDMTVTLKEGWEDGASAVRNGPNIIPKGPSSANVDANIDKAADMSNRQFYEAVRNNGVWDYKQDKSGDFAPFGNFNYGSAGSAAGFSNRSLLEGAGYASAKASERHTKLWGIPLVGFRSRGDDPVDQYWIQQGVRYFNEGGKK